MATLVVIYLPDRSKHEEESDDTDDDQELSPNTKDTKEEKDKCDDWQKLNNGIPDENSPLIAQDPGVDKVIPESDDACPIDDKPETEEPGNPSDAAKNVDLEEKPSVHFDLRTQHIVTEEFTLAQAVQMKLEELGIENDVWNQGGQCDEEYDYWQVSFVLEKDQCDDVLGQLTRLGVGRIQGTSISLFPASYYESQAGSTRDPNEDAVISEKKGQFLKTVNSRLMVAQVVQSVHNSSVLSFDFVMFVVLASMLAAMGLAENSSVIIVASMLVSPIMGPLLGGTFGIVISHKKLCKLGIKNEVISLVICVICGVVFGFITGGVNYGGGTWGSTDSWPTPEMKNRGLLRGLWVGLLIAVPSGAGVALSILGGNMGSLVGVAISASLLPPAVNAGMLWGCSLVYLITSSPLVTSHLNATAHNTVHPENGSLPSPLVPPYCPELPNNEYEFVYSCSMASEMAILGVVSLILTLLNIICIFIMGVAVLLIKKVVPDKMVPEYARRFWKDDIEVAKHTYQTLKPSYKATAYASQIAREMAKQFREQIEPDKPVPILKSSWHNLMKVVEESCNNEYTLLSKLTDSHRPQLVKQFSLTGDIVLDEAVKLERKYNTVSGATEIPADPVTPITIRSSSSSNNLRWGVLKSPEGTKQFRYDPDTVKRRQMRQSWGENRKSKHNGEALHTNVSRTAQVQSGKKFEIIPVAEDGKTK